VRQNLREIPLGAQPASGGRWLTRGNAIDRQPVYARDGERIAFSSNRNGNLEIWVVSRRSGDVRRMTEHTAQDSDPSFMPDGRLLFSSNRSGAFEIWMADSDGSGAHQITHDGSDAENPVATADGQWIIYASMKPGAGGIMRIRPDGSEPRLIVVGNLIEPEVSPDGKHVAFVADLGSEGEALRVTRLAGRGNRRARAHAALTCHPRDHHGNARFVQNAYDATSVVPNTVVWVDCTTFTSSHPLAPALFRFSDSEPPSTRSQKYSQRIGAVPARAGGMTN